MERFVEDQEKVTEDVLYEETHDSIWNNLPLLSEIFKPEEYEEDSFV